jgi:hypothetical protein
MLPFGEFINKNFIEEKPIIILGDRWSGAVVTLQVDLLWMGSGDCTRFVQKVGAHRECAKLPARGILHSRDGTQTLSFDHLFEETDHFLR